MFALIFGICAAAGWIIFDVAVSVVTYPIMPAWEWWIFVLSGTFLVGLTIAAQILEYQFTQKAENQHSHEHLGLATASLAIYDHLISFGAGAPGQPQVLVAELQSKLAELRWSTLTPKQKRNLRKGLSSLEPASLKSCTLVPKIAHN